MWRAFVGSWDGGTPTWADIDLTLPVWETARRVVTDWVRLDMERAAAGEHYTTCADCAQQAVQALAGLKTLEPGSEWTGQLDNRDLIIRRVPEGGDHG